MTTESAAIYVDSSIAGQTLVLKNQRRRICVDAVTFVTLLIGLREDGWRGADNFFTPNSNVMRPLREPCQMTGNDAKEFADLLAELLRSQPEHDRETAAMLEPLITIGSEGGFVVMPSSGSSQGATPTVTGRLDPNLQSLAEQFKGATLAQLIQRHLKKQSETQLMAAIQGSYLEFPESFRPVVDDWCLEYPQQTWIGPNMVEWDLGDLFKNALFDAELEAKKHDCSLSSDQLFSMFNLAVLRLTYFAMENRGFRKEFGIKKGWFG